MLKLWLRSIAPALTNVASRKIGVERSTNDDTEMMWSLALYWCSAEYTPTSTPMITESTEPTTSSRRLTPIRRPISPVTVSPLGKDLPKSPCAKIRVIQCQ